MGLKTAAVIPYKYEGIIPAEGGMYDACKYGKNNKARNGDKSKAVGGKDRHKSNGSVFYRAGLYPPRARKAKRNTENF